MTTPEAAVEAASETSGYEVGLADYDVSASDSASAGSGGGGWLVEQLGMR